MSKKLKEINQQIRECKKCPLHETAKNKVIGKGSRKPKVVLIGEAPGLHEDATGIPFCGPAGKELDKWIEWLGLGKEDYAVLNVLKCRPPDNREPGPEEIKACRPFLHAHFQELDPDYIVTLGKTSTEMFFSISSIMAEVGFKTDNHFIMV